MVWAEIGAEHPSYMQMRHLPFRFTDRTLAIMGVRSGSSAKSPRTSGALIRAECIDIGACQGYSADGLGSSVATHTGRFPVAPNAWMIAET